MRTPSSPSSSTERSSNDPGYDDHTTGLRRTRSGCSRPSNDVDMTIEGSSAKHPSRSDNVSLTSFALYPDESCDLDLDCNEHYENCDSDAFLAECLQDAFDNNYIVG